MDNATNEHPLTFAVDFGGGQEADLEMPSRDSVWVAVGPGIRRVDVWVKETKEGINLRVQVQRTSEGLAVTVDRGDQGEPWWPMEGSPKLVVNVDPSRGLASASATVGVREEFQEALLGHTHI